MQGKGDGKRTGIVRSRKRELLGARGNKGVVEGRIKVTWMERWCGGGNGPREGGT